MGAPLAFSSRRKELGHIFNRSVEQISAHDITNSYLESLSPEWINGRKNNNTVPSPYHSVLLKYLAYGKISLILGDSLFVHGAIDEFNMG